MLQNLMGVRGVKLVALLDANGNIVESAGAQADLAVVSAGRAVAASMVNALGSGELNYMVIDFEDGPVLLTSLGNQTLLTAFDDVANLGRVRYALRRAFPELKK